MKPDDKGPSIWRQIATQLAAVKRPFIPIFTDPAFPVFGCNQRFGEAANDTTQPEEPLLA